MKIKFTKSHSLIHPFYLRQRFTSSNKMKAGFGRQVTHLLFVLCTLSFMLVQGCNTTEPIDNTQPGRRDYVWTIDTLNYPYDPMFRMWGSSPTDIWTTSSGFSDKSISHFDGEEWSTYRIPGIIVPNAVYGFASNNIYIGAENGQIWKFDGNSWTLFAELTKNGHNDIYIENIWGESTNNFYAFGAYPDKEGYGNNAVIAHYINGKWEMLNTDPLFGIVEHLYKNNKDNRIYIQLIGGRNYTDSTRIYEYSDGKYIDLYSNLWTKGLQADISLINHEVYFVLGNKIAIRVNNKFQTILEVNNPNFYQRIWGRNSKDIFLLMTDGLAHYNGSNIKYLFYFNKTPRTQIFGAALFENEVFFLVYESQTSLNLIYHGLIKKGG